MATIDDRAIIDRIIAGHGYYDDTDARVALIVEYTNAYGGVTWGVTWTTEHPTMQRRYLIETEYVRTPRLIWDATEHPAS